ncbi:MAG: hypothetical protein ABGX83_05475 [Nitrospira sp.]
MPQFKTIALSAHIVGDNVVLSFSGCLMDGTPKDATFMCPKDVMKGFCWDLAGMLEGVHPSQKVREEGEK